MLLPPAPPLIRPPPPPPPPPQAAGWLLSVPGASRTVLEVRFPYAVSAMTSLLGHPPARATSEATAVEMAVAAYRSAAALSSFGEPILGVGATFALATDRERRGPHAGVVVTHNGLATSVHHLTLDKGARSRQQEDAAASRLVVRAVADAAGVATAYADPAAVFGAGGGPGDALQSSSTELPRGELLRDLLAGRFRTLEFSGGGGGVVVDAPRPARVYLPGSFNPLHDGHRELLAAALRLSPGMEGAYELSLGNADKGSLPLPEAQRRVAQFGAAGAPVVLTQAPLFTMKADLFPGSTFVVGYDTAQRLVQPGYYGSESAMLLQFARLAHQGCSFLVAGRLEAGGARYLTLADMEVPEALRAGGLFRAIPEGEFRVDISSTQLRERGAGA